MTLGDVVVKLSGLVGTRADNGGDDAHAALVGVQGRAQGAMAGCWCALMTGDACGGGVGTTTLMLDSLRLELHGEIIS